MLDEQRLNLFESLWTNLAIRFQPEHVRQSGWRRQNDIEAQVWLVERSGQAIVACSQAVDFGSSKHAARLFKNKKAAPVGGRLS